jgi:hypothetical protein
VLGILGWVQPSRADTGPVTGVELSFKAACSPNALEAAPARSTNRRSRSFQALTGAMGQFQPNFL